MQTIESFQGKGHRARGPSSRRRDAVLPASAISTVDREPQDEGSIRSGQSSSTPSANRRTVTPPSRSRSRGPQAVRRRVRSGQESISKATDVLVSLPRRPLKQVIFHKVREPIARPSRITHRIGDVVNGTSSASKTSHHFRSSRGGGEPRPPPSSPAGELQPCYRVRAVIKVVIKLPNAPNRPSDRSALSSAVRRRCPSLNGTVMIRVVLCWKRARAKVRSTLSRARRRPVGSFVGMNARGPGRPP